MLEGLETSLGGHLQLCASLGLGIGRARRLLVLNQAWVKLESSLILIGSSSIEPDYPILKPPCTYARALITLVSSSPMINYCGVFQFISE